MNKIPEKTFDAARPSRGEASESPGPSAADAGLPHRAEPVRGTP
jgi:hypothetical protein